MDTRGVGCANPACADRGACDEGNIKVHSRKERRFRCLACGKTFAASKGTPFWRLHKQAVLLATAVALLAHGCPPSASGASDSPRCALMDWPTSSGPALPAPSPTPRSSRPSPATTVPRIWRAFGLKPHLRETFKLSTDPFFVEKVRDVVGLHMAPPERAVVLCVDEESQVQALDRPQPSQPLLPGRAEKSSHGHTRHGTTSLFGAPEVATGKVIGQCPRRHRHQVLVSFLDDIDATLERTAGTAVHVVMDNYGTRKHPRTKEWFARRPDIFPHFAPTSASWLNQVERSSGRSPRSGSGAGRSRARRSRSAPSRAASASRTPSPSRSCGRRTPT